MFENMKIMLEEENAQRKEQTAHYIENGYCATWAENERKHSDNGIRKYSTPAKWEAYQAGRIDREKAVQLATARAGREIDKSTARKMAALEKAEAAPDVQSVAIHVEWKRSRTWGYNPHASVVINAMNRYEGGASGCGYDKRTAAVGEALNQSAVIRRMLYQAKEKALAEGWRPENSAHSNAGCINYGAGYGVLPYFDGGVGMGSFEGVFNACGLRLVVRDEGKHYDSYYFERVEK